MAAGATAGATGSNSRSSSESSMSDYDLTKMQKMHRQFKQYLWIIPLLAVLFILLNLIIGYAYLTTNEMIEPIWPYPSDLGSTKPYASYFTEFITIISFLFIITTYCRYKQISLYLISGFEKETNNNKHAKKILVKLQKRNFCSFLLNFILIFAAITMGSFRMSEHFIIHWIALSIFIIFTIVYMFIMCHLSRKLYDYGEIESKPITMYISAIIHTIAAIVSIIAGIVSITQLKSSDDIMNNRLRLFWLSNMDGYDWHLVSTISQWIGIIMYIPFLCSISRRMRLFHGWNQIMF
uniref:DNA damage-regulated autophagy modulator protein 2-like n=1 Tax=Dermatophagoides pteronyssinus TaxID=6956 RepID=A0A6P6YBD8_DERPT|nr:DNA damage-regulated autophagy modulator protein 2-like [Dermatophagoides pteronyssinus]